MRFIKKTIRKLARRVGFDIIRCQQHDIGIYPHIDMQRFLSRYEKPVIFDVGANVGQSVSLFRDAFPASSIHSFEPSPTTYQKLIEHCRGISSVKTWNYGVGSQEATLDFLENDHPDMSSFLTPSKFSWGKVVRSTKVPIITLDSFAQKQDIDFIHILKSDTQGYDFEVFKGASQLMKENRIGLIYFEFIFSDMYQDLPKFHEVFRYLSENNFQLVTFYESHYQEELVSWTDVLFINRAFNQRRGDITDAGNGPEGIVS